MLYAADLQFPPRLSFGAQRRAAWNTTVVAVQSGHEGANQNWSRARHRFDVSFAVRTASEYDLVVQHFQAVRGRFKAFPFQDPLDFAVSVSRGVLVDDALSPSGDYQLAKTYGSGDHLYERFITRPKLATVAIFRLRGAVTTNITGSSTIDEETGLVTFTGGTVESDDVLSWSGEFYVPCRYDTDELPAVIVNKQPSPNGELFVQCDSIPIVEVREPLTSAST